MMALSWNVAFHQLWMHAAKHRGVFISDDKTQGWPRTRGPDVLAIASVVDPAVRGLPPEPGNVEIQRRWRSCASDVADFAVDRPNREYVQNRAFWARLAATMTHLASVGVQLPHQLWPALLGEIGRPVRGHETDGDRHLRLAADAYDEMWRLQMITLARLRGLDVREPLPGNGLDTTVPRTTNRDILQLATFWTLALIKAELKRDVLGPERVAMAGLDGVKRRWKAMIADIDAHARNRDPGDVYAKNYELWSTTAAISVTLSAIDDMPLSLDFEVGEASAERRNGRPHDVEGSTFDLVWTKLRDDLGKARRCDIRTPLDGASGEAMLVPRTTNADILQLASYWNRAWTQLEDAWQHGDVVGRIADPLGLADERARWQAVAADVEKTAKAGNPGDVYPRNHEFWRTSRSLAATLDRFRQRPTPSQLAFDLPEESLPERVVDFLSDLGGHIADAADSVVHAVGNLGREAGKGFFDGLGVPLFLGASGVVALWLLLRHSNHAEAE
jgi:hypothetical protein